MTKTTKKNNQIKKRLKKVVDKSKNKWYTKQVAWGWHKKIKVITKVMKENGLWKLNRII